MESTQKDVEKAGGAVDSALLLLFRDRTGRFRCVSMLVEVRGW